MFSGLSVLVVEDVADGGDAVVVTARTRDVAVPCPVCGTPTAKVHGYHGRTVTDVPVDGRQVVVHLRVRRLVCPVLGCRRQTFREQIEPGEDPWTAVVRECQEELGTEAVVSPITGEHPLFLTVIRTRGQAAHTDVSLWYILNADAHTITSYDQGEFNAIRWHILCSSRWLRPRRHGTVRMRYRPALLTRGRFRKSCTATFRPPWTPAKRCSFAH
ncbi:transposase family protein [Streptomyces sp. F001]|uniref:transposase family protein n=1 Tax=Streptomyces sp. F001 TaxID=1510026 RepID=UPI0023EA55A5|nr:transposase family protein [Streptomyces sp. F001]